MLFRAPNNLGLGLFATPVGHFGASADHFGFFRMCRVADSFVLQAASVASFAIWLKFSKWLKAILSKLFVLY